MATQKKDPKSRTWNLQNDITLTVTYGKALPIAAIANFLANMMEHFKRLRDEFHEEIYKGGECVGYATLGRKFCGNCHLAHKGDETGNYLSTDNWVKAIIVAYSSADTVISMMDEIEAYRAQADGWLKEVVSLLDKRGGDLDAFEVVLTRSNDKVFR